METIVAITSLKSFQCRKNGVYLPMMIILFNYKKTLYVPLEKNKESIDLVIPPYMLQITTAKTHDAKELGINAIKTTFREVSSWKLCFVTPFRRKGNFKPRTTGLNIPVYIVYFDYSEEIAIRAEIQSAEDTETGIPSAECMETENPL